MKNAYRTPRSEVLQFQPADLLTQSAAPAETPVDTGGIGDGNNDAGTIGEP